jgi:hypothetical protein
LNNPSGQYIIWGNQGGLQTMTAREAKKVVSEIKALTKKLTPAEGRELLVKAGICTPDGKLTKPYKQDV